MRFLKCELPGIADHPHQEVGRVRAGREELGVRAAVRDAGNRVGRFHDLGHVILVGVGHLGEELGLEVGRQRQVEHRVDRVLAHLLADLGEGQSDVLLQLRLGLEVLDHDLLDRSANGLRLAQFLDRVVHFRLETLTHLRVGELGHLLFDRAGRGVVPGR